MINSIKHVAVRIAGVILVMIGIVGLIFPILPGWVFIIPGAMLLGFDIGWVLWALERGEIRFPRFRGPFRKLRSWVHNGRKAYNDRNGGH